MHDDLFQAPIGNILPSFSPVHLERGIPGYEEDTLIVGESRLSREALAALLVASGFIGAHIYAVECEFDFHKVADSLRTSVSVIPGLTPTEAAFAIALVERFHGFHIIRAEHALDDWVCEALWPAFQGSSYSYPSAMSRVIRYGLSINQSLWKCELQY